MIKFCRRYVIKNPKFSLYICLNLVICICSAIAPLITGSIINYLLQPYNSFDDVIHWIVLLLGVGTIRAVTNYAATMTYTHLQALAGYSLNADTLEHIKRLPQIFFNDFDATYYNQQINHDANDLTIFVINSAAQILTNVLTVFFTLIVLASINVRLFLLCITLSAIYAILYVAFKRSLYKHSYNNQEETAIFFARLQEQLENVRFIKTHVLFDKYAQRLLTAFNKLYKAICSNQRVSAGFSFNIAIIATLSNASLFIVGAAEILKGRMQPGYLVTAINYFSLLMSAIQYFVNIGKNYQEKKVCLNRLKKIWSLIEEKNGTVRLNRINSIECKQLTFSFSPNGNAVFTRKSFRLESGNIYGIQGANGCGKSTLLSILIGLYPYQYTGEILYNGIELKKLDRYYLRKECVGLTEQEAPILSDTLIANLTVLCNAENNEVYPYIEKFGLNHLLKDQNTNREKVFDAKRTNLSGGEKQKIAIIRQLLKKNQVMLFDEPTSALDSSSKLTFLDSIRTIKKNRIIVIVSHDQDVLNCCDQVIKL